MKILTAAEMGAADRRTAGGVWGSAGGFDGGGWERGRGVLSAAVSGLRAGDGPLREGEQRRGWVCCGAGAGGGGGTVRVVLLGRMDEVKGEAAGALGRLRDEASAVVVREVVDEAGLEACEDVLGDAELLVDAVVGTGFKPPLRGLAVGLREMVEGLKTPVVAVDLPSGWDCGFDGADGGGGLSGGCGGDVYGAEDGACVWASDAGNVWAGGGSGDRVAGGGGGFFCGADLDGGVEGGGGEAAWGELPIRGSLDMCWWWAGATGRLERRQWLRWRRCGPGRGW